MKRYFLFQDETGVLLPPKALLMMMPVPFACFENDKAMPTADITMDND